MKHLDLFSGIGGFALAAQKVWGKDHKLVGFCEIDPFCQKVLQKHWPDVKIYKDIRSLCGKELETVELITGGFPCQPFSIAGKRKGQEDDRYLWPEMFRIIREIRPKFIVCENVPGIVSMELDNMLADLESEDYITEAFIIPACGVDAPHRRDRLWIISYSNSFGCGEGCTLGGSLPEKIGRCKLDCRDKAQSKNVSDACSLRSSFGELRGKSCKKKGFEIPETQSLLLFDREGAVWKPEPGIRRMANGVPNRVDRLRGLGNAIVPRIAEVFFQMIKEREVDYQTK